MITFFFLMSFLALIGLAFICLGLFMLFGEAIGEGLATIVFGGVGVFIGFGVMGIGFGVMGTELDKLQSGQEAVQQIREVLECSSLDNKGD